eukprot:scaffold140193_cov15-Tisochrysis_lutea.AAC.1
MQLRCGAFAHTPNPLQSIIHWCKRVLTMTQLIFAVLSFALSLVLCSGAPRQFPGRLAQCNQRRPPQVLQLQEVALPEIVRDAVGF